MILLWGLTMGYQFAESRQVTPRNLYDVFRLMRNIEYRYEYYYKYQEYFIILSRFHHDSGTVTYRIGDSTRVNDTTVAWSVQEVAHLSHRHIDIDRRIDTSYTATDTLNVTVLESMTGRHELSADAMIWKFPLTNPDEPVFRYAEGETLTLARVGSFGPSDGKVDTLRFSQSLGFYSRTSSGSSTGQITKFFQTLRVQLVGAPTSVSYEKQELPHSVLLQQNYPNPFNPSTQIRYSIKEAGFVSLKVYDVLGKEVCTLELGQKEAGSYSTLFNAVDLPSGVYFYLLTAGSYAEVKKMLLLK